MKMDKVSGSLMELFTSLKNGETGFFIANQEDGPGICFKYDNKIYVSGTFTVLERKELDNLSDKFNGSEDETP